jgi:glucosamine kinase
MPDPTNPPGLIVGIDIGGTKTHLRALGPGDYRRDRILPSQDWRSRDWQGDARRLLDLSADLVGNAHIDALGVGAHGCDDTSECAAFQAAFRAEASIPVTVVNDAELMPLAVGLPGQIGVVAGTGSIAVHRTAGDELVVAGGWGWIIGDEGSAAGLVREAVRTVAQHLDCGGSADDALVQAIFTSLDVPNAARLGSRLGELSKAAEVGRHADAVFRAADLGSPLAQRVIDEGGKALADLVGRLLRRGVTATHVVAGGGVIVSQPRLWQAFTDGLRAKPTEAITSVLFTGKPVEGAMNLALTTLQVAARDPAATSLI